MHDKAIVAMAEAMQAMGFQVFRYRAICAGCAVPSIFMYEPSSTEMGCCLSCGEPLPYPTKRTEECNWKPDLLAVLRAYRDAGGTLEGV